MSQKQFLTLIAAGIFCALLFAAPGLYRLFKEFDEDKTREEANKLKTVEPAIEKISPENYQALTLEQVRELSGRGDSLAYYELGRRYDKGIGIPANRVEAIQWYLKAAKEGVPEAQFNVGVCYELGWIESKEKDKEALDWYQLAASQGLFKAQVQVAQHYLDGAGVEKNEEEAKNWFRRAAEQGDAEAAFKLSEIILTQQETDKTSKGVEEGIAWMRKAAELGNGEAQFNMGNMSLWGVAEHVPQDLSEAANWWKKAAANGNAEAKNFISEAFYRSQQSGPYSVQEKVLLYIKATEHHDADAAWELGKAYADGMRPFKKSITEAVKWHTKASEKGHVGAQTNLGHIYLAGHGIEKNPVKAFELFQAAANKGGEGAQSALSMCYEHGLGCEKSLGSALMWETICKLTDPERWLFLHESMHQPDRIASLKKRMTPDEIETAESRAREWYSSHGRQK